MYLKRIYTSSTFLFSPRSTSLSVSLHPSQNFSTVPSNQHSSPSNSLLSLPSSIPTNSKTPAATLPTSDPLLPPSKQSLKNPLHPPPTHRPAPKHTQWIFSRLNNTREHIYLRRMEGEGLGERGDEGEGRGRGVREHERRESASKKRGCEAGRFCTTSLARHSARHGVTPGACRAQTQRDASQREFCATSTSEQQR